MGLVVLLITLKKFLFDRIQLGYYKSELEKYYN